MQKWEYMDVGCEPKPGLKTGPPEWRVKRVNGKIVQKDSMTIYLNRVGQSGWELVSATHNGLVMTLVLKRPMNLP